MSDKTAYVLSESDLVKLKETMDYVSSIRRNKPIRDDESTYSTASDVYVARVPAAGIPALTVGTSADRDVASKTVCQIYQIIADDVNGTTPQMMIVDSTTVEVYNVFAVAIAGNSWVPIAKDKFGTWLVTGMPQTPTPSISFFNWDYLGYIADPAHYPSSPSLALSAGVTRSGIAMITVSTQYPPGAFELATALASAPTSYLTVGNFMSTPDVARPGTGVNTTYLMGSINIDVTTVGADSLLFLVLPSPGYPGQVSRVDAILYG